MVAISGVLAARDARAHGRPWLIPLVAATVLGTAGPMVAAAVFRDQPDEVVAVATVLFLQAPLVALAYTVQVELSPGSLTGSGAAGLAAAGAVFNAGAVEAPRFP